MTSPVKKTRARSQLGVSIVQGAIKDANIYVHRYTCHRKNGFSLQGYKQKAQKKEHVKWLTMVTRDDQIENSAAPKKGDAACS